MDWFAIIKKFYTDGDWTKEQVAAAVVMGKITPEQYEEITGDKYEDDKPPADES
ncbi:XkdX family protein [Niallia circulans]|uniref:XkdX family protein n=1 Tax=Niallia circulans TaxID=1397 RepID=UPI0026EA49C5|nr:XkdX family protein [Niallia circulans]